ncbi:MAG: pentapeptide repeat-containing protein [Cyanothece sp. SIO1E1]|nr:pentapeptide repeat-containing protein [Cyanothece sp. SIO1E1]
MEDQKHKFRKRNWFQRYWFSIVLLISLGAISAAPVILGFWGVSQLDDDKKPDFIAKLVSTVATSVGGVVLLLNFRNAQKNTDIAYENAKLSAEKFEQEIQRSTREAELANARLLAERFSKAIEQLGADKITVRLGGIYSLEKLSQDSPQEYYWTVMEVLSSFVKESSGDGAEHNFQIIPEDIQAALTVIKRRDEYRHPKQELTYKIDLTNSNLKGAKLNGAFLASTNLGGANLRGADLQFADLRYSNLVGTDLREANLYKTKFSSADLRSANFRGARKLVATQLVDSQNWSMAIYDDSISSELKSFSETKQTFDTI